MHILVLLEANFLNINNDKQIPLQPTENVHTSMKAWEMVLAGFPGWGGNGLIGKDWKGQHSTTSHIPLGFDGMSLLYT